MPINGYIYVLEVSTGNKGDKVELGLGTNTIGAYIKFKYDI